MAPFKPEVSPGLPFPVVFPLSCRRLSSAFHPGALLQLPNQHRIPLTWLLEHGGPAIRYRTYHELAPPGYAAPETVAAAAEAIATSKAVLGVVKQQKDDGSWGGNLLGLAPQAAEGIKAVGTIPQYRRLLQLGWPRESRPFKLSDRLLFRLVSRDQDPTLLFEHRKLAKNNPEADNWARALTREAATAALAEAGYAEDPRVRGAAHKIANDVSGFLRSPLAEAPLTKAGGRTVLHPNAHPPSWYTIAMVAAMPNLQRERAGFTERLGVYLTQPAPKKQYAVMLGKNARKPPQLLLGDPIVLDAKGAPKDLPLALLYLELLARMGALTLAPTAENVLARLLGECDGQGIWSPKNLRVPPKAADPVTYHCYPLVDGGKTPAGRAADVTFRIALIAKLLGWSVDYS